MLKATLAKAAYDALSPDLKTLYVEQGGAFVLDVDGMTLDTDVADQATKLAEFRENNRKLHAQLQAFEGLDPSKVRADLAEFTTLKTKGVAPADIQSAIAAALAPIEAKLTATELREQQAQAKLTAKLLEDKIWEVGAKAGVEEWAKTDFIRRAMDAGFTLDEDGDVVAKKGDTVQYSKRKGNAQNPYSVEEFTIDVLPTEAPGLFKTNKGAGGNNNGKPGADGARVIGADSFGDNLEAIAKGQARVSASL